MNDKAYVLITPARNEEAFIAKTIQAVISQTILPRKWVIVSDGSTDRTDANVQKYAVHHDFIQLIRLDRKGPRNFASKVHAFNVGCERLRNTEYAFIGNLDADVSFESDYYESILKKFHDNEKLGIAGGVIYDKLDAKFERLLSSRNSVPGPIQLFRRQCFEDIGGYIPQERGGVDAVAEIMARMHGWEVEAFSEFAVYHYRRVGTAAGNICRVRFRQGIMQYVVGYHPLFQVIKCLHRIKDKPYGIGALLAMCGYFWACFRGYERRIPDKILRYFRSEQMERLRLIFTNVNRYKQKYFHHS
jgi:glycosyltransferase involved in cell wall biosynthesis